MNKIAVVWFEFPYKCLTGRVLHQWSYKYLKYTSEKLFAMNTS